MSDKITGKKFDRLRKELIADVEILLEEAQYPRTSHLQTVDLQVGKDVLMLMEMFQEIGLAYQRQMATCDWTHIKASKAKKIRERIEYVGEGIETIATLAEEIQQIENCLATV